MPRQSPDLPDFGKDVAHLAREKAELEAEIAKLPPGGTRMLLQRKLRRVKTALQLNEWLTSPGLRPPTNPSGSGNS